MHGLRVRRRGKIAAEEVFNSGAAACVEAAPTMAARGATMAARGATMAVRQPVDVSSLSGGGTSHATAWS